MPLQFRPLLFLLFRQNRYGSLRLLLPRTAVSHQNKSYSTKIPAEVRQSTIQLRQYQEECIQAVVSHVDQGKKRLGVSLATGAGKTVGKHKSIAIHLITCMLIYVRLSSLISLIASNMLPLKLHKPSFSLIAKSLSNRPPDIVATHILRRASILRWATYMPRDMQI